MTLQVRTVALDDPRELLSMVPDGMPAVAWVRNGDGIVGWGEAARILPPMGPGRFRSAEQQLMELAEDAQITDEVSALGTGLVGIGSFTFDDDRHGSVLVVPRVLVGRHNGRTWLTTITAHDGTHDRSHDGANDEVPGPRVGPPPDPVRDRPRYAGASNPDVHWLEVVAAAIARIRAGELDKVVLARDHALWSREPFDVLDVARRLSTRFADCHTFVVDGLVGATPELLVARHGAQVTSRVLAGTAGRDADPERDAAIGRALLASSKDRWEHELAVSSVRERLAPHCSSLRCNDEPDLLRLANVQHLATTFTGQAHDDASALAIAADLHPTAAVGGTPRDLALGLIRELEGMDRQRYAAPVGWVDVHGDGEWGIALRCAQLDGARARLFAGVGIVGDSLPEDELAETRLKLLAMQAVLGDDSGERP